jgi:large subunit ribosomal protein L11
MAVLTRHRLLWGGLLQDIAKKKMADMNAINLAGAMSMVEGTAKSLGLVVVD